MMRKRAKHSIGCTVREGAAEERGVDMVGRLEKELDRQRERGQKKGRDIVTVGGGDSGCILPAQPVGMNKRP